MPLHLHRTMHKRLPFDRHLEEPPCSPKTPYGRGDFVSPLGPHRPKSRHRPLETSTNRPAAGDHGTCSFPLTLLVAGSSIFPYSLKNDPSESCIV